MQSGLKDFIHLANRHLITNFKKPRTKPGEKIVYEIPFTRRWALSGEIEWSIKYVGYSTPKKSSAWESYDLTITDNVYNWNQIGITARFDGMNDEPYKITFRWSPSDDKAKNSPHYKYVTAMMNRYQTFELVSHFDILPLRNMLCEREGKAFSFQEIEDLLQYSDQDSRWFLIRHMGWGIGGIFCTNDPSLTDPLAVKLAM